MKVILNNDIKAVIYDISFSNRTINGNRIKSRIRLINEIEAKFNIRHKHMYPKEMNRPTGLHYIITTGTDKSLDLLRASMYEEDILKLHKLTKKAFKREILDLFESIENNLELETTILG